MVKRYPFKTAHTRGQTVCIGVAGYFIGIRGGATYDIKHYIARQQSKCLDGKQLVLARFDCAYSDYIALRQLILSVHMLEFLRRYSGSKLLVTSLIYHIYFFGGSAVVLHYVAFGTLAYRNHTGGIGTCAPEFVIVYPTVNRLIIFRITPEYHG